MNRRKIMMCMLIRSRTESAQTKLFPEPRKFATEFGRIVVVDVGCCIPGTIWDRERGRIGLRGDVHWLAGATIGSGIPGGYVGSAGVSRTG